MSTSEPLRERPLAPAVEARPERVIGIVGGLGPFAHIELERRILAEAKASLAVTREQQFPEWIVSSIPQTPDRTQALLSGAESPALLMIRSLRRLEGHRAPDGQEVPGADFAVIPCNTSHAFLGEVQQAVSLPILDMVVRTVEHVAGQTPGGRVGILATTGTIRTGLYDRAFRRAGLVPVSLFDVPDGESVQQRLVMETIYGRPDDGNPGHGGIKGRGPLPSDAEALEEAAQILIRRGGAQSILLGCTELSIATGGSTGTGEPYWDPLTVAARHAVSIAYGLEPLPERAPCGVPGT